MGSNRSLQCCKQGNVNSKIKVVCKRSFLSSMGNGLTRSMDGGICPFVSVALFWKQIRVVPITLITTRVVIDKSR